MAARLDIVLGRIEQLALDAVVNAANRHLLPGAGVDGALRRAAGPELTRLTETLQPLAPGEAIITPGFDAPAKHIIHVAAPMWFADGAEDNKIAELAACYRSAIATAHAHGLATIGFPCLGTGIYGWPAESACDIAIENVRAALTQAHNINRVVFCCFLQSDADLYAARLN